MKKINFITILFIVLFSFGKIYSLTDIKVNDYSIVPFFDKDIYTYNVFINDNTNKLHVDLVLLENEICLNDSLDFIIEEGINKIKIYTIKDNIKNTYILNVVKGELNSYDNNSLLYDLSVYDEEINFSPNIFSYKIHSSININDIQIHYIPYNPRSNVKTYIEDNNIIILVNSYDKKNQSRYSIEVINDKEVFKENVNSRDSVRAVSKKEKTFIVFSLSLFFIISSALLFKFIF